MYLNSDYCYMVHKEHHQDLLREAEQRRLLHLAAHDALLQARIVRRIAAAVKALLHVRRQRSLAVREVTR